MEVISKVVTYTGFAPFIVLLVLCMICYIMAVRKANSAWDKDLVDFLVLFGSALLLASMFCLALIPTKHERYRLRVNDSVTVNELSKTYEIIEYDRDTDLWLVEKRKEE